MIYRYYVILCDRYFGGEFGVYISAKNMDSCLKTVAKHYPECGVIDARKV